MHVLPEGNGVNKPHNGNFLALTVLAFLFGLLSLGFLAEPAGRRPRTSRLAGKRARVTTDIAPTGLPRLMLWAWERPEDLRFLNAQGPGVAFLAGTIYLSSPQSVSGTNFSPGLVWRPRLQPLRVAPGTPLMAVIRIETPNDSWRDRARAPAMKPYTAAQLKAASLLVANAAKLPRVQAVQIDYDASSSERAFYAQLLQGVRRQLPPRVPLSITALASWCLGDPWLEKLPPGTIDEAVPMLFRMGPDAANVAAFLQSGGEFQPAACRASVGLSTDEPFSRSLLNGPIETNSVKWDSKRIYVFSPQPWTKEEAQTVRGTK
jgi:hypothetical protein